MPRGRKKNYKGGHRHFTDPNEIKAKEEKERKEREWRKQRGIESDSDEEKDGEKKDKEEGAGSSAGGGAYWTAGASGASGALPPSESETDSSSGEEEEEKAKGVSHLINIENPNHAGDKMKKVSELETGDGKPQLTRKQREEIQKQQAKANYMKAHLAGKTDEAQADMARLALIRKQREEAAAKKNAEKEVAEAKKKAAEQKLLDKKAGKNSLFSCP